jgi:hypothetical protein
LNEYDSQNTGLKEKKFRYTGTSMRSTFKPGQVLYVHPKAEGVQPGDVVVYQKDGEYIVHRVKTVQANSVTTRGDNNPRDDKEFIPLGQIVGVVEKIDDWGNLRPVTGGRMGLWLAHLRWGAIPFVNHLRRVTGAPYRWLKARHWIGRFWHPEIITIQLLTPEGIMVKYLVRGKTVATWQPQKAWFTCRRPYDLVIFPPK